MRYASYLTIPLLLLSALGCGRGGHHAVAPVSGRVTLNNRPLAHAEVRFYPAGNEKGTGPVYSHAKTDAQGLFTLRTFLADHEVAGGLVGDNRVEISLNERDLEKPSLKAAPNPATAPIASAAPVGSSSSLFASPAATDGSASRYL